ncbi:expressed unknown protein [Seminavis robusta]|uniref:Uncharacterized protein n=1 Tax=Seminavis robusta TaxID=568900 RepID=A0A9N8DKD2_9STRA|nr:expressed unknown protein [Seminavis robusta]CAB9503784.1 expressed unknown protein [Seminavis robusta]|eukprot:Sro176_g077360.1 n/a (212) ;mRNA; r:40946-41581
MKLQLVFTAILGFVPVAQPAKVRFLEVSQACIDADAALEDNEQLIASSDDASNELSSALIAADGNDDGFCSVVANTSLVCTDIDFDEVTPSQDKIITACYGISGARAYKANIDLQCSGEQTVAASFSNVVGCFPKECSDDELTESASAATSDLNDALLLLVGGGDGTTCNSTITEAKIVPNPSAASSTHSIMVGIAIAGITALLGASSDIW